VVVSVVSARVRVMLEGLSDVAWSELEHAYGSAADVPDLIRALRASDPEARKKARWHLYGNIFHQGTRYEASAYAVPFLLELLADPATPERTEILDLLTSLAIGYDESWLPDTFPVASYRQRAVGGEQLLQAAPTPTSDENDDSSFRYWESLDEQQQERMFAHIELAVYDAVRAGVPLYCDLLADEDPHMRTAAAYALAWFFEDAATSVGPLTTAAGDPQTPVAAAALVALGLIGTDRRTAVQAIRGALTDHRDLVRWGAAVAIARLQGPAADPPVVAELLAWTGSDRPSYPEVPYLEGNTSGYAGLALRQLGDTHADAAFDALLARIPAVSGPEALPVVGEALRRAFPAGSVTAEARFAALDQRQQRLLQTLADSPTTWRWGQHTLGNFTLMVGAYGLPRDVEAMRSFVTEN
jgi:HEAT repeat protein